MATLCLFACQKPEVPAAPVDRARASLARGDALGAEIQLERLIQDGTPRAELAAYLGEAALMQGDLVQARRWLGPGKFSTGTRVLGLRMLGRLEMAEGELAAAGAAFDAALVIKPDDPDLWVDIGRLRYRGGEQVQAIAAANKAIQLAPDSATALQFRGEIVRDADGLVPAVGWFRRALDKRPDDEGLRADLAATLGDAGHAREALEVLRTDPTPTGRPSQYVFIQAVIAARGGDFALAQNLLERSGAVGRGVPAALMLSALIDCAGENFASAAQTLERLAAAQPDNRRVTELFAYALSQSGSDAELVHRFGPVAASSSGTPYLRTLVGRSLEALDQRAEAARFLDLAAGPQAGLVALPPGDDGVGTNLGISSRDAVRGVIISGRYDDAKVRAADFVRRFPGSADGLALLGDANLAARNLPAARAAYAVSARVRRPWPLALRMTAAQENASAATGVIEDYLRANPANGEAAATLADAYAARGDWTRAALLLDHAMRHGQDRSPYVLAARSVAAARNGDPVEALNFALRAHALQPLNPAATATLIAALSPAERETRAELEQKLRSLVARQHSTR